MSGATATCSSNGPSAPKGVNNATNFTAVDLLLSVGLMAGILVTTREIGRFFVPPITGDHR